MKMLFMGRKSHGAAALNWCVNRGIEVVGVLTDTHLAGSPTASLARDLGLPLLELDDVYKSVELGVLDFDVAVSYVYWRIVRQPLIGHPRYGIVNFHPAPLPDLKGTGGYNVAILEGRESYGVTAHYIDEGIDTGPVIECAEFAIDRATETAQSLEARSQNTMLDLFKRTVDRILVEGELAATHVTGGRYVSRSEMEALKELKDGDDVDRKIRAFWFPPYRGAFVTIGDRQYTLVNDTILENLAPDGTTLFSETTNG